MDRSFWQTKKRFPFWNSYQLTIPAYAPLVFRIDTGDNSGPQASHDYTGWTQGTTIRHGQLAFPVSPCGFNPLAWRPLYAVNGPFDVGPNGYGEASIDYPLPMLIDPNTFPIYNFATTPLPPPTPGTWQQYQSQFSANHAAPPACGPFVIPVNGVLSSYAGATFMSPSPQWDMLTWDIEADGSTSTNRVWAVPTLGPTAYSFGGTALFNLPATGSGTQSLTGGAFTSLVSQQSIQTNGLYSISVFCEIEIDTPGAAVQLKLGYLQSGNAVGSYIATAGRQAPKFTVGDADIACYPNDKDAVTYSIYGYETVSLTFIQYMGYGDNIYLDVTASEDCKALVSGGNLSWVKVADRPFPSKQ